MSKRILVIQGHPDPERQHFCHALADAYSQGARAEGHTVQEIEVAALDFPWLRSAEEFEKGNPPPNIKSAQNAIEEADHLVFIYPLWLGDMPAILKAFLEQTFRPGFVTESGEGMDTISTARRLKGISARIVVTMGMPGFFYRFFYRMHSLKSFKRNILQFCGIRPVKTMTIGMSGGSEVKREQWLKRLQGCGRKGI